MARSPGVWLLALPALLFQLPGWAGRLQLDFGEMAREPWRWVTCHWTHWSLDHLAWDLGAFLLLAAVCESYGPRGRKALLAAVAESAGSFVPAPLAHLTGGACGLFAGGAYNLPNSKREGFDAQEARADG